MGGEVGNAAWSFILKLVPSESHLTKLKSFLSQNTIDWNKLFSIENYSESIYYLYLLQALIADESEEELAEIRQEPSFEERQEIRKSILKHKGVQWAINTLKDFKVKDRNKIGYMKMITNLISIYIIGSMSVNNKIPKEVKQYSFKLIKEYKKENKSPFEYLTSKFLTKIRNGTHNRIRRTISSQLQKITSFVNRGIRIRSIKDY